MGHVSTEPAPTPVPGPRSAGAATVLARSRVDLATALAESPDPRAVVMTMGALHEGHFDLVREAARRVGPTGTVVVTIFVNPLQFAPTEDLDAYPRDLEGDLAGLARTLTGVDGTLCVGRLIVFAPTPEVIYPAGQPAVRIDPGPIATVLEGRTRPTHFAGVCQVVLTLMHLTAPRWALFGRKDAQQLAIIESMVRDLAVPLEIVPVDIRRENDGLAMSSRNAYLSPEQRHQALALSRALQAGRDAAAQATGSRPRRHPPDRTGLPGGGRRRRGRLRGPCRSGQLRGPGGRRPRPAAQRARGGGQGGRAARRGTAGRRRARGHLSPHRQHAHRPAPLSIGPARPSTCAGPGDASRAAPREDAHASPRTHPRATDPAPYGVFSAAGGPARSAQP